MRSVVAIGIPALLAGLLGATLGGATANAAQAGSPDATAPRKCAVVVERKYVDGAYQVWQQELDGGKCRCYIQTGRRAQSDTVERAIAEVMRERVCGGAPVVSEVPGLASKRSRPVRANALTN